jgi:hypothetical protein
MRTLRFGTLRKLSDAELEAYRVPFADPAVRGKVWLKGDGSYSSPSSGARVRANKAKGRCAAVGPAPTLAVGVVAILRIGDS